MAELQEKRRKQKEYLNEILPVKNGDLIKIKYEFLLLVHVVRLALETI